jgi:hypothetical protein
MPLNLVPQGIKFLWKVKERKRTGKSEKKSESEVSLKN